MFFLKCNTSCWFGFESHRIHGSNIYIFYGSIIRNTYINNLIANCKLSAVLVIQICSLPTIITSRTGSYLEYLSFHVICILIAI